MKKLVALFLAILMCMSSFSALAATDVSALDPTGVELKVLIQSQVQHEALVKEYLEAFAAENGIKVTYELAPSTGYTDQLTLALAEEKQAYDLVMCNANHWGPLIDAGWIMPLDEFIDAEAAANTDWYKGIMTSALDACVQDGKRWSVAYSAGVGILLYNKAMLEEAGLAVPTTMDEVLDAAAKLTDPANNRYGLAFRGGMERGIALPWLINWLYEGGTWYPENAPKYAIFDTPAAKKATEQLVEMYKYAPTGIDSYAWQEAQTAMQQGFAGIMVDTATLAVNLLNPEQTDLYDQFAFGALDGVYSWGDGWCFSIASRTEHPEWCWEIIKKATSYEVALDQILKGSATTCYRNDVYENEAIYEVLPADLCEAVKKSAGMASIVYWPLISQMSEIQSEMKLYFYDCIKGKTTVDECLAGLQESVINILERDGVDYK